MLCFTKHPAFHLIPNVSKEEIEGIPFVLRACDKNINQANQARTPSQLQALATSTPIYSTDISRNMCLKLLVKSSLCVELVCRLLKINNPIHKFTINHIRNVFLHIKNHFLKTYTKQFLEKDMFFLQAVHMYFTQSYREAVNMLAYGALFKHGESHAQLATILIEGRPDVPKDYKKAFELALAGTNIGCQHSKGVLGLCYIYGLGVDTDKDKGYLLGLASSRAHCASGQFVVGKCYDAGWSVQKSLPDAISWYSLAASVGQSLAQLNLARFYRYGCCLSNGGVEKNKAKAEQLWRLAAAQGNDMAHKNLKNMSGSKDIWCF